MRKCIDTSKGYVLCTMIITVAKHSATREE